MKYGQSFKRMLCILFILLTYSCDPVYTREWIFDSIEGKYPCYNSAKLILRQNPLVSNIDLEFVANDDKIQLFLNLLTDSIPKCEASSNLAEIRVIFDEDEVWTLYPFVLEGGQKLLFPEDATELFISALLDNRTFVIRYKRLSTEVIPANFAPLFETLQTQVKKGYKPKQF